MKYLVLCGMFLLAGCENCHDFFDTSPDQGKCWRECAQAAAASRYFQYNFDQCIKTACGYKYERKCQ